MDRHSRRTSVERFIARAKARHEVIERKHGGVPVIKRFIERMLGNSQKAMKPRIIAKSEHGIDRSRISGPALKTCETLQSAGHQAFVVGGAVRDLLLGYEPKDFDVATSALPEDVRGVFRRSRIIGRRFRLVHVLYGQEVVEVSTFRAPHSAAVNHEAHEDRPRHDEHGRILSDNVFGTQADDALRRDITINALFYDPGKEEVWDFVGGLKDLRERRIRIIGDAETRFREDPVRMLRVARFAGKLGFTIDKKTLEPIGRLKHLLENIPDARLFDETLKLLLSGHARDGLAKLTELDLHRGLLPLIEEALAEDAGRRFVDRTLAQTDERVLQDKGVSSAFLFAALLWPHVQREAKRREGQGMNSIIAMQTAGSEVLEQHRQEAAIPRRLDGGMMELWTMQPRFLRRSGAQPFRVVGHPRYRAAWDFLVLRAHAGDLADAGLPEWWDQFAHADDEQRRAMLVKDETPGPRKRRRRRRRGSRGGEPGAATPAADGG